MFAAIGPVPQMQKQTNRRLSPVMARKPAKTLSYNKYRMMRGATFRMWMNFQDRNHTKNTQHFSWGLLKVQQRAAATTHPIRQLLQQSVFRITCSPVTGSNLRLVWHLRGFGKSDCCKHWLEIEQKKQHYHTFILTPNCVAHDLLEDFCAMAVTVTQALSHSLWSWRWTRIARHYFYVPQKTHGLPGIFVSMAKHNPRSRRIQDRESVVIAYWRRFIRGQQKW